MECFVLWDLALDPIKTDTAKRLGALYWESKQSTQIWAQGRAELFAPTIKKGHCKGTGKGRLEQEI